MWVTVTLEMDHQSASQFLLASPNEQGITSISWLSNLEWIFFMCILFLRTEFRNSLLEFRTEQSHRQIKMKFIDGKKFIDLYIRVEKLQLIYFPIALCVN